MPNFDMGSLGRLEERLTPISMRSSSTSETKATGLIELPDQKASGTGATSLPAVVVEAIVAELADLPDLPVSLRGLSIDTILQAIGDEARRNGVQSSIDNLKTQGDSIKAEGDKKLEEIKKELEKLKHQSFWDKFVKAFKIIGAIFGAIASVATIAVGVVTGNPLMIIGGALGAVMAIDSIVSTASDGKYSIAAGFTELGKKLGMSDEAAQWFGFGMNLLVVSVGIVVGLCTGSAASSVANLANATKGLQMMAQISAYANVASALANAGGAIGSIGQAVVSYQLAQIKANKIDIDAILERMREQYKITQEFIESELDTANKLMEDVTDIVADCGETATAILTASPSMA